MTRTILNKYFLINSLLVFLIFFIDRISKIYVINLDKKFLGTEIFTSKYLNISLIWNEGIAFGLLSFNEGNIYNILTCIILFIIIIVFYMFLKSYGLKKYSLLMILGGALGNIYDRIFYRAVPDFIDFHIGEFHWFIFNFADIFISVGIIFMIIIEIVESQNQKKT